MIADIHAQAQELLIQEEPRYPVGDAFFSGNPDAVAKLREFAHQKGFQLEVKSMPDGTQHLEITPALLFNKAFADIFNVAQSGRLGKFEFGLVTGRPPAQDN